MVTLSGGSGDDSITGDPIASDSLSGLDGNDTLVGLGGNDTLVGGNANDLLDGGAGVDSLLGGAGNDTLLGGADNDRLDGGDGNDTLIGGAGADVMNGGSGGGGGIDTASYEGSSGAVSASLTAGGLSGEAAGDTFSNIENLTGSSFNDSLVGNNSANVLTGGSGNDTLNGSGGDDILIGGAGADSLIGGGGTDTADYSASPGLVGIAVTIGGGAGVGGDAQGDILAGDIEIVIGSVQNDSITGSGNADSLFGGLGNDILVGAAGADLLSGGFGDDTLIGGSGNDQLVGGDGSDTADYSSTTIAGINASLVSNSVTGGSSSTDTFSSIENITGSNFADTITGDTGSGVFSGLGGNDSLFYGSGDDTVYGGDGNDTIDDVTGSNLSGTNLLDGGAGNDVIWGGFGNDTLIGGSGDDTLWGEDDNDSIVGDAGTDTLYGGLGNDTLAGGDDNDQLLGDAGNDSIDGGAGADSLSGSTGNDTLRGGAGADSILAGDGNDTIIIGAGDADTGLLAETVSGGGSGINPLDVNDRDVLDLQAYGWSRVDIAYTTAESGTITFFAPNGTTPVGTMTFSEIETIIPCFTAGTLIETDIGPVAVERLQAGDLVLTRDNGLQRVRWAGQRRLSAAELLAQPDLRPVKITAHALGGDGPLRDMMVSPQHRILVSSARAELLFGDAEVLVAARHLVSEAGVAQVLPAAGVTYVHVLFDRHEIILSEGLWTESFQPAQRMVAGMDRAVRDEVLTIFPELAVNQRAFEAARPTLKTHEVRVLLSA